MLNNTPQVCIAIKRIYVHASIYHAFVKEVAKVVETLVVGPGMDKNTVLVPVQNEMQYRKLQAVANSIKEGGFKMLSGNLNKTFTDYKGFFVNPLIVDNPPDDSEIVTGEPFGENNYSLRRRHEIILTANLASHFPHDEMGKRK
jgi:acyl-CoA reductase-like NAD-dependent aldehyde dehydrogenase